MLGFVFLYPFLFMISRSLMSYNDIVDATVKWFPKVLSPGNYALAFQTLEVPLTGLNSLIVTLLCTLGHVVACAFIGYAWAGIPMGLPNGFSPLWCCPSSSRRRT